MTTTPADELHAAASLLRDRATAATHEGRTRWTTGHTLGSRNPVVLDDPEQPSVLIETYAARLESVNAYVTLLGPAAGLALTDWLTETARFASLYASLTIATTGALPAEEEYDSLTRRALAVARQILGTTTPAPAMAEDQRATADLLATSATEYRVPVPEQGGINLHVRRQSVAFGTGWSVAVPGWGGGRAWTQEGWQEAISALSVDRLFCWPDATTAVDAARCALAAEEAGR